jgi:hypothetical protein
MVARCACGAGSDRPADGAGYRWKEHRMSVFIVAEFAKAIDDHGADQEPVRWSDDPQGGPDAARYVSVELRTFDEQLTVLICPSSSSEIDTVADLGRELDERVGFDLPILWTRDPDGGREAAEYLTVELETFDGQPTVVIFPV